MPIRKEQALNLTKITVSPDGNFIYRLIDTNESNIFVELTCLSNNQSKKFALVKKAGENYFLKKSKKMEKELEKKPRAEVILYDSNLTDQVLEHEKMINETKF